MAVPLVEDQKQQTALENTARTLAAVAIPERVLWTVFTKILLVAGITWFAFLVISESFFSERRSFARSLTTGWNYEDGMLNSVLNSIDPVEMSFRFMEIENNACRKRTLCELSATPLIGQFVRYISPSINSLTEYQDAMSAGEALQDCALLFAECPRTSNLSGIKNE